MTTFGIRKLSLAGLFSAVVVMAMSGFSCANNPVTQAKASSILLAQVALRQQQLASPTAERLAQMQAMGMRTENLGVQRIFIYLSQPLNAQQTDELHALGITPYSDSWIPPVGNHPTGFILADMPVASLDALAAKDYVIKLDTAETKAEPQSSPS